MSDNRGSPFSTGLACKCPRCGEGALFAGFLTVRAECPVCQLDYSKADSGDGPAIFIIPIAGAVITVVFTVLKFALVLPDAEVLTICLVLAVALPIALMRPFKATLVALQYHHSAAEGRLDE